MDQTASGPPLWPPSRSSAVAWLLRRVPALDSLRTYSWNSLGRDATAGLTVATVAVPQAMAYAMLAGLPPQYGLYTAIVMTAVGALLDSSRQLINGPTNALSIALLSALAMVPEGERIQAAIALAFLVGVIQLGIALLRLGDLTRFISHSVIVGFTLGAGILLLLDQSKHLLGLQSGGDPADHFLQRFWLSMRHGGAIHWPTVLIGGGTILIVVAVRQINNALKRRGARFPIPQHLVAVVAMAGLVWSFQLDEQLGIKIVGNVPAALPAFEPPDLRWDQCRQLAGSAFALALLGLLEAIAMSKAIASRNGQKLDINQQCLSEGAANLTGSVFQCFPGSGSLTRSTVNQQAGAVSQWSGVFAAIAVAATVLLFAPLARYIPRAALAGLLVLAAYRMVDGRQLRFHLRASRFDAGVVLATALAAIFISVEFCIVVGVFLSFVLYVPRAAQVQLTPLTLSPDGGLREQRPGDATSEWLRAYELEGELFFGAEAELARHFATIERAAQNNVRAVLLILRRARNTDATFLSLLKQFHEHLELRRVTLLLGGIRPDLMTALGSTGLNTLIGRQWIFADGTARPCGAEAIEFACAQLGEHS
jgi:sulfate permease, SulP family